MDIDMNVASPDLYPIHCHSYSNLGLQSRKRQHKSLMSQIPKQIEFVLVMKKHSFSFP